MSVENKKDGEFDDLLHWEDLLTREFKNESDRACVILGASLLDSALETSLKSVLMPTSSSHDSLFDGGNAPLGTFSSRIKIAHRLNLFDAAFARSLHLIRKIRNDFAHNITGCTFESTSVINRMTELKRCTGLPDTAQEIRDKYQDGLRGVFQMIVSHRQWQLRSIPDICGNICNDNPAPGDTTVYIQEDEE